MKRALIFITLLIFLFSFSFVAAENATKIGNAYTCLGEKITERDCSTLTSEEKFFSLLSLNRCGAEVVADSVDDECWPSSGCTIKDTAQAILSLNRADQDTAKAETWLAEQKAIPGHIVWYIQVDSNEAMGCEVTYAGDKHTFSVALDKKVTGGNLGRCLDVSSNGYWLEVSSSTQSLCYDEEYEISCNKNFLSNLLFTKSGSSTINVLDETQTAPANGATLEKINSFCFSTGARCDYEGSLWASMVLDKRGKDVSGFLPYLITMEEDNFRYLPESFLYMLTQNTDYSLRLLAKQKPSNNGLYWSESGDRFYDTALALYPFRQQAVEEKENSQEWLLTDGIQGENGCWEDNIRNTGFLLYSIWPEYAPLGDDWFNGEDGNGTGNGTGSSTLDCFDEGYFCRPSSSCYSDQGQILNDYSCAYPNVCCSVQSTPLDELCEDLDGTVCDFNEECKNGMVEDTEGLLYGETCCIGGTCEASSYTPPENDCEDSGGLCRSFGCNDGEEGTNLYSCESGETCCVNTFPDEQGKSKWIIWVLVILVILIVIALVFRDKLRRILFGAKTKMGRGDARPSYGSGPRPPRPPEFPAPLVGGPRRMPTPTGRTTPRQGGPQFRSQKELDDVLVKLKDMGGR